jgi:FAD/FMN-containing dehydrogenase
VQEFRGAWSPETFARLAQVRTTYDPDGLFPYGVHVTAS